MRLSLHEVLAVVGRLDDRSGFDSPRERFRRFLFERVTDAAAARACLEDAQHHVSEQYQRALQDIVAACGRPLGFDVSFGVYERHGLPARVAGQWTSRADALRVSVVLWSDASAGEPDVIAQALASAAGTGDHVGQSVLSVVAPTCGSRARIEAAAGAEARLSRVVSLRGLIDAVTLMSAGHATHRDIVDLIRPKAGLDESIGLLSRLTQPPRPGGLAAAGASPLRVVRPPAFWVYVVPESDESLVQRTLVDACFSLNMVAGTVPALAPDDRVAFLVPVSGVVAKAEVASVEGAGAESSSEAPATYLVRMREVTTFEVPVPVDTESRLSLELQAAVSHEPLVRMDGDEFQALLGVSAGALVG